MAGFSDRDSIWLAAIPALGNFVFTLVGLLLVDRIGRRRLLLGSMSGVVVTLALLGVAFYVMDLKSVPATPTTKSACNLYSCGACVGNSDCGFCVDHVNGTYINGTCSRGKELNGTMYSKYRSRNNECLLFYEHNNHSGLSTGPLWSQELSSNDTVSGHRKWYFNSCPNNHLAPLTIVALFLYIAFFAPGMGPLPWTINSEIYPTWARSTAIAIATTTNWVCNLIVSMSFLTLTDR